jgi:PAS domain S-box-containing protein
MSSEFEGAFARLTSELGALEVDLGNLGIAAARLAPIKHAIETLYTEVVAEHRQNELIENSLQESESYNKVLFQQSHRAMVVFDPETDCFIDSNQAAAEIFGYSLPHEIIGKTPVDMAAPTQYDGTDSAIASRRRDRSALTEGIESFEWRHQRPNGEIWDAMVHLMAFNYRGRRLLQATLEDITQRRKAEEALRESRQLLESVLENSAASIYAKRKDGRYTYLNHEMEVLCGVVREQVLGKTDFEVFPGEIAQQWRTNDLNAMTAGKLSVAEETIASPRGERLVLSKKVPLTSASGDVEGICGISTDITDLRQTELALREAVAKLERERDNKLANVEVIMASIAHEVRQPLTAIAVNGSAARRFLGKMPPDTGEVAANLDRIINDCRRASEVFDSILILFRRNDQKQQPIDVNEIAFEVLQSSRGELAALGVTARTEFAPGLPLVAGHRTQLQQVISNLVQNAIEAMGSISERDRVLRVKTRLHSRDAIIVAVEDTGPGFDPKQAASIFDAFFTTKSHGVGLGLAICRMIVERHGGQLAAASDGQTGAQFQIVLPTTFPETVDASRPISRANGT